tara:strand:+ start:366 stop:563 length:198 start_codon:yes stop_codon:yes gene_type:complete
MEIRKFDDRFDDLLYHGKALINLLDELLDNEKCKEEQLYSCLALTGTVKLRLEALKKKGEKVIDN